MAAQELIPFTEGFDESDPTQIGQGQVHTIIPVFGGRPGAVEVWAVQSNDDLTLIARLSSRPTANKLWQVAGPIEYVVRVKNAGADVDTGA